MQSRATTVEQYLAEAPPDRVAALQQMRELCRRIMPHLDESIAYGMPAYHLDGVMVTAFASQKNYIAFYAGRAAIEAHRAGLSGLSLGKGCIRYVRPAQIDFAVVRSIFEAMAGGKARAC